MVELGTVANHVVTLNISYMQVHPAMDSTVLPLGVSSFCEAWSDILEHSRELIALTGLDLF